MEIDEFAGEIVEIVQALCVAALLLGGYLAFAFGGYFNHAPGHQAGKQASAATQSDADDVRPVAGMNKPKRFSHTGADLE